MSQKDRDYSEKRDFIRMQIETTVALEHGDTKLSGTCIDLSSTGMQVLAGAQLRMGDKVRVLIPSKHSELKGLDAQTEVVRVSQLDDRSEEHTSELQSLMRNSYAVFFLKKKKAQHKNNNVEQRK